MSRLRVVLVGDIVESLESGGYSSVFDYDNPTEEEVAALADWFSETRHQVTIYRSVTSFVDAPPCRDGATIVFPLWRGGASRNRTAIVPALCETLRLPYVGGDAFVQSVCQHKGLSKVWAQRAGFAVPRDCLFSNLQDAQDCRPVSQFGSSVVVKPLYSACSIGISDSSLCHTDEQVVSQTATLLTQGLGPVLCEEFINGDEVSICVVEERGQFLQRSVVVYRGADGKCPFFDRLFTFDAKIDDHPSWRLTLNLNPLHDKTWQSAETLVRWLGKVDCFRFDGRLKENGSFVLVELTPDIHLSTTSTFLGGFLAQGVTPAVLLDQVVQSSMRNQNLSRVVHSPDVSK